MDKVKPPLVGPKRLVDFIENLERLYKSHPVTSARNIKRGFEMLEEEGGKHLQVLSMLHYLRGSIAGKVGSFEEAITDLEQSLSYAVDSGMDRYRVARTNNELGVAYGKAGNWQKAIDTFFTAMKLDVKPLKATLYVNTGLVHQLVGKFEAAETYIKKGLDFAEKTFDKKMVISALINLGNNRLRQDKHNDSIKFYTKALKVIEEDQSEEHLKAKGRCLANIGLQYVYLKRFEDAVEYLKKSVSLFEESDHNYDLVKINNILAKAYAEGKYTEEFERVYKVNMAMAKKYGFDEEVNNLLLLRLDALKATNDYEKALKVSEEIIEVMNRKHGQEQSERFGRLVSKKEEEIKVLEEKTQQIELQNIELESKNLELEQYAYIVAHDLREPLRNISSFSSLLHKKYFEKLDDKASQYIQHIVSSIDHMDALLVDLLKYATLRKESPPVSEINCLELIEKVIDSMDHDIKPGEVEIILPDKIPLLLSNSQYLGMLFQNLFQNALKFKREHPHRIELSYRAESSLHMFSLQDNGIGIKEDHLSKIFNIFTSLEREKYGGTGIGLAICQKVVNLFGGQIWAESEFGKWTRFNFTLSMYPQFND